MALYTDVADIYSNIAANITKSENTVQILNSDGFRKESLDGLIYNAVFNEIEEVKAEARWLIKTAAQALGIRSASIQELYEAMGRGDVSGFVVPAINIRGLTYDTARAIFRSAKKNNAGAFIFEIAKSEIGYTGQSPFEYAAVILGAAIREGYRGPVFIQGDHFQANAKSYVNDKEKEIAALKGLIESAVEAGFCNIDIDASTLVDLDKPTVLEQQRPNFETTAELTEFIRDLEQEGVTVSVGGEIGEVGGKNSTEEELKAFMEGFTDRLKDGVTGISKISVQTGTSHGGVVLPDGTIAKVKVDFDTIKKLSRISRDAYGLSGVVQHGASTLPDDAFHLFVNKEAAEVHLATGFQNMIYDSNFFPGDLKNEVYAYIKKNFSSEHKEGQTEEQFIYKTRKKGFGPFKKKMWDLPVKTKESISKELEDRFEFLFKQLNAVNTKGAVEKWVSAPDLTYSVEKELKYL